MVDAVEAFTDVGVKAVPVFCRDICIDGLDRIMG